MFVGFRNCSKHVVHDQSLVLPTYLIYISGDVRSVVVDNRVVDHHSSSNQRCRESVGKGRSDIDFDRAKGQFRSTRYN